MKNFTNIKISENILYPKNVNILQFCVLKKASMALFCVGKCVSGEK